MANDLLLKKFGKYFLLDQLAQGGMAEIYRARQMATEGLGRMVVIKRIQAGFDANSDFIKMFKDEINTTMGFNHPNIVQLYDFGEELSQPFIAMELVDGRNIRQFMNRFNERKESFPIELATFIIEQAAHGLHYAHSYRDKITGQPLNIVHRDISPQNILISFDASVKVIDFGIAKATTNSESTRAGVIKGKPSYLSPEQISGDALDGRSDIFALGIVLWEVLVGKKPFQGESDLAVLKMIESCNSHIKAPSTFNAKVPKELDYIVLKALAKQKEKRFQTAGEFQRELHKFLFKYDPDFNPEELSLAGRELFQTEIVEDRKKIQRLNEKLELLLASGKENELPALDAAESIVSTPKIPGRPEAPTHLGKTSNPREQTVIDMKGHPSSSKVEIELSPQLRGGQNLPSRSPPQKTGVTETGFRGKRGTSATVTSPHTLAPTPPTQTSSGISSFKLVATMAAGIALIVFIGPQFGIKIPGVTSSHQSPTPIHHETSQASSVTEHPTQTTQEPSPPVQINHDQVMVKFLIQPTGEATKLTINGKLVDSKNPQLVLPLESPINAIIERPGYKKKEIDFVVSKAQLQGAREWPVELQLEPEKLGYLTIRSTPSADVKIIVNGDVFIKKTPLENERMPAGNYSVQLDNPLLGMWKKVTVELPENKSVVIDERLEIKK